MRLAAAALAASFVLGLGGCYWPTPGQGPDRQSYNVAEQAIAPDTVGSLHRIWARSLGIGSAGDAVTSTAGVHVADQGRVYLLDAGTGEVVHTFLPAPPLTETQPIVNGKKLLTGQWNKTINANDDADQDITVPRDPATLETSGGAQPGLPLSTRGNRGLFWDVDLFGGPTARFWGGYVQVRDLRNGALLCCEGVLTTSSANPPPPPPEPLTLGRESVFHAGQGINDRANPTSSFGNGLREFAIRTDGSCPSFPGLYLCPDRAVALDGSTATPPVLADDEGVAYVATNAGTVYAVDLDTFTVLWSRSVGSAVTAPPALAYRTLYVPSAAGTLTALDVSNGAVRWSGATGSAIRRQPAVAGGVVFTGSADGTVAAFDAGPCGTATCPRRWSDSAGSEITGAPAVSAGQLYVGTADGRVLAYGL